MDKGAAFAPAGANRQCGAGESIWRVRAPYGANFAEQMRSGIEERRTDIVRKRGRRRRLTAPMYEVRFSMYDLRFGERVRLRANFAEGACRHDL